MSEVADFTIDDGAATPVAVTFKPELVAGGNATFRDERTGLFNLMPRLRLNSSLATAQRPTHRFTLSVSVPKAKTVDGVQLVDYVNREELQIIWSERSTEAERADALAFLGHALLEDGPIRETILKISPPWG